MVNANTAYFDQILQEILGATTDNHQSAISDRINTYSIERMVSQCYALLRQELERKVKLEPDRYSKERVESILGEFKTVIPDIQQVIATRVLDGISELMRQEIQHVLKDALNDLGDAVVAPVSKEEKTRVHPATTTGVPAEAAEARPVSHDSSNKGSDPTEGSEEPLELGGFPWEQPVHELSGVESNPTVDELERQPPGTLADTNGSVQQSREEADDEIYQGDVKVSVDTLGSPQQITRFLNQLGSSDQLRVLRMVGSYQSATIWLSLHQPLHLKEFISQMKSVSEVRVRGPRGLREPEHILDVVLEGLPQVASLT